MNRVRQGFRRERLQEEGGHRLTFPGWQECRAGIGGHEEDRNSRLFSSNTKGKLHPIHLRHPDIGQEEMDRSLMSFPKAKRFRPAVDAEDSIPLSVKNVDEAPPQRFMILGEQNRLHRKI